MGNNDKHNGGLHHKNTKKSKKKKTQLGTYELISAGKEKFWESTLLDHHIDSEVTSEIKALLDSSYQGGKLLRLQRIAIKSEQMGLNDLKCFQGINLPKIHRLMEKLLTNQ